MGDRFRAVSVLVLSVLMLLSAPWLLSQDKDAPDEKSAEKDAVEKNNAHRFGGPCELTTCVTKVLYLSNISQPTDLQDLVNAMHTIAEISRVQQIVSARMVIVRTTPEQAAMAEQLADEIDKAKRRFGGAGYRVDVKVSESEGDKKGRSRVYSLVTEARDTAELSIGRQAPAPSESNATADKKSPDTTARRNIECRILAENERTVELHVNVSFSHSTGSDPTQLRVKDNVTLELGKPTVIGVLDDPESERAFQVEVTATRVKEK